MVAWCLEGLEMTTLNSSTEHGSFMRTGLITREGVLTRAKSRKLWAEQAEEAKQKPNLKMKKPSDFYENRESTFQKYLS